MPEGISFETLITVEDLQSPDARDFVFVDCRFELSDPEAGRRAYFAGHIPGAHYAHLDQDLSGEIVAGQTGRHPLPQLDDFRRLVGGWGLRPNQQAVVYDQGHGGIAARLWWMLNWLGHDYVAVLDGGWQAYTAAGLPINNESPPQLTGSYPIRESEVEIVDRERVSEQLQNNPDLLLIDARDPKRFSGEEEPIDPVAGHIDGAVNMPFKENISMNPFAWKSKAELMARWSAILEKAGGDVVMYCGSGVTACHNILAVVHAGGHMPKLYPGSWSEWITQEMD